MFQIKIKKMKLLAVNISKLLDKNDTKNKSKIQKATERAWKIKDLKYIEHNIEYVISVASGRIYGYFKLKTVSRDTKEPHRASFSIKECSNNEKTKINIFTKGENLKYFVTKFKW
ncbi:MAG: hypothetical protein A3F72_03635 [Bacteroidetes bacterium RIFCSPLOWO2_12_FULL_35_15]|nr:MAG: hypothetical protein A3F72_03635 [Bacteroidetes bacterium RIFCSPLOWO2_12_FULL_35_15]